MKIISNLAAVILINMCFLFAACSNNQQAGEDASGSPDTNVNGAPEITDKDYNIGKKEDNVKYGNDAANNQTTVGSGEATNKTADSNSNPSNDPHAMQEANTKMSGLGESGHAPANNSGPAATDPNNKARKDTVKYK